MTDTSCAFGRIVRDEAPTSTVFEDIRTTAFLDRRPIFPGHVLLIPRQHCETIVDLPHPDVGSFFASVQLLAQAVEIAVGAEGTFVAINNRVSQSVPHLHVHIVPRKKGDGLRGFFWPRIPYDDDAHRVRVQQQIRRVVSDLLARNPQHDGA